MGRSYWFECAKCGYRATVSGRADRGINFFVQTIFCRDCKALYDAVTRMRFPDEAAQMFLPPAVDLRRGKCRKGPPPPRDPPSFQSALARLPYSDVRRFRWVDFQTRCPLSPRHRVQPWNAPDKCPRCGIYLEKNVLPYRIWE
jgi:hypothetical protein